MHCLVGCRVSAAQAAHLAHRPLRPAEPPAGVQGQTSDAQRGACRVSACSGVPKLIAYATVESGAGWWSPTGMEWWLVSTQA